MQFKEPSKFGRCPRCGKEVPIRSSRSKPNYCSRVCASIGRFSLRYKGTNAGPLDRPNNIMDKTKG